MDTALHNSQLMPPNRHLPNPTDLLQTAFGNRKVFVTGHTGFKGSWLCEWLLDLGAEVGGFSLPAPVSEPSLFEQLGLRDRVRHLEGDIRDAEAVRRALAQFAPDFVFHLAAQPLVRLSYSQPVETWQTNVIGSINVLEAVRHARGAGAPRSTSNPACPLVVVMVTTDKCYENREWVYGYREEDPLGGHDPYSSSKAAAEIAISSWRRSFFDVAKPPAGPAYPSEGCGRSFDNIGHPQVVVASARAGNVIGGGDWALDRIVPDAIRSLSKGEPIPVRNPAATRPWQHVLEPLSGYLLLAASLEQAAAGSADKSDAGDVSARRSLSSVPVRLSALCSAFNFGPALDSNRPVSDLAAEMLKHWPGEWEDRSDPRAVHEAGLLNLAWDKAFHVLGWRPTWDFETTVRKTVEWYRAVRDGACPRELTRRQIREYGSVS